MSQKVLVHGLVKNSLECPKRIWAIGLEFGKCHKLWNYAWQNARYSVWTYKPTNIVSGSVEWVVSRLIQGLAETTYRQAQSIRLELAARARDKMLMRSDNIQLCKQRVNINRNFVDIDGRVYKWREETSILLSSFLNHRLDLQLHTPTSQRNSITLPTPNMLATIS